MKTKIFLLTVLLYGLIIQKSGAQCSLNGNSPYSAGDYLGWSSFSPGTLPFSTNGVSSYQMLLTTSGYLGIGSLYTPSHLLDISGGDININTSANGYMVSNNYVLYTGTPSLNNIMVGVGAGTGNTGSNNTFVGASCGDDNGSGTYNTYIGYEASGNNISQPTVTDVTCLGYMSGIGSIASDCMYLGDNSITNIYANTTSISTYSDRRIKDNIRENIPGLAFITRLHPVTYNLNIHRENELMGVKDSHEWAGKYDVEKIVQSGFIAQQVDSAAQACGYNFNGINRPKTSNGLYSLGYTDFVVPLVKAVQELSTENDSLRSALKSMQLCLDQICTATGDNNFPGNISTSVAEQNITLNSANAPVLYQNTPNPFNAGAKINYYLPEGTTGASIVFYDNRGGIIKAIQISQTGNGTLDITPDNLSNGIYSYSLIVNGNVLETKRMVVQK
jgi:trimeric autotransporter adhesin